MVHCFANIIIPDNFYHQRKVPANLEGNGIMHSVGIRGSFLSLYINNPHNVVANISFALMRVPSFIIEMKMAPLIMNKGR